MASNLMYIEDYLSLADYMIYERNNSMRAYMVLSTGINNYYYDAIRYIDSMDAANYIFELSRMADAVFDYLMGLKADAASSAVDKQKKDDISNWY